MCTHWHTRTSLLLFDIPYYLSDYFGHYSHPQKLFTSNSQLQLNSEALSFLAYKPRFVSLSCFFLASLFLYHRLTATARWINFLLSASDSTYPYDRREERVGRREGLSGVGVAFIVCHAHAEQTRQGRPTSNLAVAKTKVNICLACVCVCVCVPPQTVAILLSSQLPLSLFVAPSLSKYSLLINISNFGYEALATPFIHIAAENEN